MWCGEGSSLPNAESHGLGLGACRDQLAQGGWQLWQLTEVFHTFHGRIEMCWIAWALRVCRANPCRQVWEWIQTAPVNAGFVLHPSVPGGEENKPQQVILAIAAGLKPSHNSFKSCMPFEKQPQLLKGCKLIIQILLKIYPLGENIENFYWKCVLY